MNTIDIQGAAKKDKEHPVYTMNNMETQGEISSNLYRASVCDMKKGTFLLISLTQILYYTLQTTWYGMRKNILGKLPDHF